MRAAVMRGGTIVADIFEKLGNPDEHAKVLVEPWR